MPLVWPMLSPAIRRWTKEWHKRRIIISHSLVSCDMSIATSKVSSPQSELMLPVSISNILYFFKVTKYLPTSSPSFYLHVYPSLYFFFNNVFLEGSSYARCEQSSYPFFFVYVGYSSSTGLCVTLQFLT